MLDKNVLNGKDYYAVIFSNTKSDDMEGYAEMDNLTMELAAKQKGYLGFEAVSNGKNTVFVSYWETKEDINEWSKNAVHLKVKANAHKWYTRYLSQICKVENSRYFEY